MMKIVLISCTKKKKDWGDKGGDKGTVLLSPCLQNGTKYDIIILPVRKSGVFDRRWLFFFSSFSDTNDKAPRTISSWGLLLTYYLFTLT